ncbi:MAG TPA: RagB/SusD family nutrient uptake outer membrane protein, partial [Dysgonomonas sp.]|nr:RagB/SusD family nutrient uptake outer membrane protein [Dysgonomonas sp.]
MKHTVILFSIVASLFFAACGNGWLDDIQPSDKGESSTSIKSVTDAQYALNGIYDLMRNYQYYGARYTYYGDVTGEDMQQKPGAND